MTATSRTHVLEARDVVAGYVPDMPILHGVSAFVDAGEIVHAEDVQHGLENAPATVLRLFRGENLGKQLLEL